MVYVLSCILIVTSFAKHGRSCDFSHMTTCLFALIIANTYMKQSKGDHVVLVLMNVILHVCWIVQAF